MKSSVNTTSLERGILSSVYKNNVSIIQSKSLSKIKKTIKQNSTLLCCQPGTVLRVSLFFLALVMIVF